MLFLENLKYMRLYKKQFYLPIDMKDKKHGSVIMLMSPSYEASKFLMNYPLAMNRSRSYQAYYLEKDIMYTIKHETGELQTDHIDYTEMINEQPTVFTETTDVKYYGTTEDAEINDLYCRLGDKMIFFNEMYDDEIFQESDKYNARYRLLLYNDRIKNNREIFRLYDQVKSDNPWIKRTFISLKRYNKLNLFVDLYYYHNVFMHNNTFSAVRSIDMYREFIRRFLMDKRLDRAGYHHKIVFIPVDGWPIKNGTNIYDYMRNLNPFSMIYHALRVNQRELDPFGDMEIIFIGKKGYFKANMREFATGNKNAIRTRFIRLIGKLQSHEVITDDDDEPDSSEDGITASIVDKLEKNKGIVINKLTQSEEPEAEPVEPSKIAPHSAPIVMTATSKPSAIKNIPVASVVASKNVSAADKVQAKEVKEVVKQSTPDKAKKAENNISKEVKKQVAVNKIRMAAKNAKDEDEVLDKLDADEEFKKILIDLQNDPDDGVKVSASRATRIAENQDAFMQKQLNDKTVKEMVNESNKSKELPEKSLPIKSINDEWSHLKAVNFEKEYDLDADIVKCLNCLAEPNKVYPINVLDIEVEDTSTSEDSIYTWTVKLEDYSGKRTTLVFDIPKLRDNRFMRLRGNEKIFSIEMPLIPISKTDPDTVQIVSSYKKIFVSTYYTSSGKSNPYANRLIKALTKYKGDSIKTFTGDNTKICNKYELPIDYIDMASQYSRIEVYGKLVKDTITIYFNQDEIRALDGVDPTLGIPIARKASGEVYYYDGESGTITEAICQLIDIPEFQSLYEEQSNPKKSTYSRASILNSKIPVIVILAHDLGLTKAMQMANIEYDFSEKKPKLEDGWDIIKLSDAYIYYKEDYCSMMLMNGLKDCNTEDISTKDINSKMTWVNALANFCSIDRTDGLDNFKQLMYDPITVEVSKSYGLPTDYHEALIYASNLLVDNKYAKHTDISTNRYRTNEVIAAQFYLALSTAYGSYATQQKRGRKVKFSMAKTAVIDAILAQNTTSDLSIFQPLYEIEAKNMISTKGVSGMNQDRAYKIDKRGYDDSMVNIIARSTNFSDKVGVNRQTTINPNIEGGRGYFKQSGIDNMSVTNTYGITEALSPFAITSDDPIRLDMQFTQSSKHGTPTEYSSPLLVTTGADAAMPYLASDMFAHKAKHTGTVEKITDTYMVVKYQDGTEEFVNLDKQSMKNSDGGFYITLQLKTDLKEGDKVKPDQILAYDKKSFSNRVGSQLAYNVGVLVKHAVMSTEDGYEDSGSCSEWMSEVMASDIVVMKDVTLPALTNILQIAKKGQSIKEGDPLLIFQNSYDEKDANILLKNLNADDGDISEIGRNVIKSKVTGIVSDIKIYRTCDIENMSESLAKIVQDYEKIVNKFNKTASKASNYTQLLPSGKQSQVGKTKNVDNGVLIEFYMQYHDKLGIGDKIVVGRSNKNVLMDVYKDSLAPYTDLHPNEAIDDITSAASLDGRMITSTMKEGALNKALIELSRKCCDIYGVPWKDLHQIYDDDIKNNT